MSDSGVQATGPGARLEAARRKQGLHIAALAAQLKVSPARLEALEAERWELLPDATHARALATSVCRVLGIDPAPVLAGMPRTESAAMLDRVSAGLNQPVRDGGGLHVPRGIWWMAAALLLAAALALALWPRDGEREAVGRVTPEDTPSAPALLPSAAAPLVNDAATPPASVAASTAGPVGAASVNPPAATAASVPAPGLTAATAPVPVVATGAAVLEIRAENGASWISVTDAQGVSHAARLLQSGEVFTLPQVAAPVRVTLGNAPALRLAWRGQAQPLDAYAAARVARLELK